MEKLREGLEVTQYALVVLFLQRRSEHIVLRRRVLKQVEEHAARWGIISCIHPTAVSVENPIDRQGIRRKKHIWARVVQKLVFALDEHGMSEERIFDDRSMSQQVVKRRGNIDEG